MRELDGEEIEGVDSSLPPEGTWSAAQVGTKVVAKVSWQGELCLEASGGGNDLNLGIEGAVRFEITSVFGLGVRGIPGGVILTPEISGKGRSKYPL